MTGWPMAEITRGCISDGPGPIRVRDGGWKEWILFGGGSKFDAFLIFRGLGHAPATLLEKIKTVGLPAMNNPLGYAQARVGRLLARPATIPLVVHKVVRHAMRGRDLDHVQLAVDPVLLDRVLTTLGNGDLRLVRRIHAGRGRGRFRQGAGTRRRAALGANGKSQRQ